MNFLIFDTETTGFTKYRDEKGNDLKNHNRMTQLAFMLVDIKGDVKFEYSTYIKPDNWFIPEEDFFIENGMSTEICENLGVPVFNALRVLQDNLKLAKYKVAHNISFDNRIVSNEITRAKITRELFQFKKGICTMRSSRDYCMLPYPTKQGIKNPNLNELHEYLFEVGFDGAHEALADVRATTKCLFELIDRGIIKV